MCQEGFSFVAYIKFIAADKLITEKGLGSKYQIAYDAYPCGEI